MGLGENIQTDFYEVEMINTSLLKWLSFIKSKK